MIVAVFSFINHCPIAEEKHPKKQQSVHSIQRGDQCVNVKFHTMGQCVNVKCHNMRQECHLAVLVLTCYTYSACPTPRPQLNNQTNRQLVFVFAFCHIVDCICKHMNLYLYSVQQHTSLFKHGSLYDLLGSFLSISFRNKC